MPSYRSSGKICTEVEPLNLDNGKIKGDLDRRNFRCKNPNCNETTKKEVETKGIAKNSGRNLHLFFFPFISYNPDL